jgi:hypothetical protein
MHTRPPRFTVVVVVMVEQLPSSAVPRGMPARRVLRLDEDWVGHMDMTAVNRC